MSNTKEVSRAMRPRQLLAAVESGLGLPPDNSHLRITITSTLSNLPPSQIAVPPILGLVGRQFEEQLRDVAAVARLEDLTQLRSAFLVWLKLLVKAIGVETSIAHALSPSLAQVLQRLG